MIEEHLSVSSHFVIFTKCIVSDPFLQSFGCVYTFLLYNEYWRLDVFAFRRRMKDWSNGREMVVGDNFTQWETSTGDRTRLVKRNDATMVLFHRKESVELKCLSIDICSIMLLKICIIHILSYFILFAVKSYLFLVVEVFGHQMRLIFFQTFIEIPRWKLDAWD